MFHSHPPLQTLDLETSTKLESLFLHGVEAHLMQLQRFLKERNMKALI